MGSFVTECPPIVASPDVGAYKVDNMEMVVVFPAPFGPSRLKISPSLISKDIPLTAVKSPYRLTRLWTCSIAVIETPVRNENYGYDDKKGNMFQKAESGTQNRG